MEAFIGYTPNDDVMLLKQTLEAWDMEGIEPVAIQCQQNKYEVYRRLAAENMSEGDYLLVDFGCLPHGNGRIRKAIERLYDKGQYPIGMVGKSGVRICRKGVIDKWPEKRTTTYDEEHEQAYRLKGYDVLECPPLYKVS